jgi:hypothetical protein
MIKFIKESKWRVQMMTPAPNVQFIEKVLDAPSQEVAISRAQQAYPNQTFVQVTATSLDQQSSQPTPQGNPQQQTTMGRMRGLSPLQGLAQPGQQPVQERIDPRKFSYPYSITLPAQFSRVLRENRHGG